jgi:hypothetical protein
MLGETLDMTKPVHFVATIFDLAEHVAKMRAAHPAWSDRQCACCLYWQGGARKFLRQKVREWLLTPAQEPIFKGFWHVVWCPEAQGVNLTWQPWPSDPIRVNVDIKDGFGRITRTVLCVEIGKHLIDERCYLTATMRTVGIELEWPPVKFAYQIVLVGMRPMPKAAEARR